ncbi:hypothetical protein [Deinococcus roseus]|uniref:Uncharacterized protein n=1 Tax=Deinococcus roseus TaxID=392414 RepID=A0ABQ2DET7_9DEIO|nr:hypothetical protein [Deinococcus roseus]GGJ55364.1 hypothetical protein GCM10008938_46910 [Deinococcus roseus]
MTLFQSIPQKALRDNRDHIIVVTQEHHITTLQLRDIFNITPHHQRDHTVVHCRQGGSFSSLVIQEGASVFLGRCQGLLEALRLEDSVLINQHYCPKLQAS